MGCLILVHLVPRVGPVCPACGGPFGACPCNGQGKPKIRAFVLERVSQREAEIREWAWVVELGLSLIMVGLLILLV